MAENLKEIKKIIVEDWLKDFPQLSPFSQNKLYKILGPTIVGIELINLPRSENYRPHFVIYPLWKSSVKSCLDNPVILNQIYNRRGLQFNIPYSKHNEYVNEAVECAKNQILISMNDNVSLDALFETINRKFDDVLVKSNSAQQAKLLEFKYYAALYAGSHEQMKTVLSQIQTESKNWNMQMFNMWYGDLDLWLKKLHEFGEQQQDFFKSIRTNKSDKKLIKLKQSDLIVMK